MTLNVRLRQHLGLIARGAKRYEAHYVDVCRDLIGPADLVFDVGANIGVYTLSFAAWTASAGKVIAFEPDPANLSLLESSVRKSKCENVVIRKTALGKKPGRESFSVDRATGSTGHLGHGPTYGEVTFGAARETLVNVEVTTLDDEAERWGPPNFIKLDVESGEFDVLSGGRSLLERHRPFLISELSDWNDDSRAGENTESKASLATKLLSDCGYSIWDLDTGSPVQGGEVVWMVLALPRERMDEDRARRALARLSALPG